VHEEHITRLNDVRELIDTLIRLVGVFRLPGAINQAPRNQRQNLTRTATGERQKFGICSRIGAP